MLKSKKWFTAFLICFCCFTLHSKEISLDNFGCFLDLPEGWKCLELTESKATFADNNEYSYFQIKYYPGDKYKSSFEMYTEISKELKAEGSGEDFRFSGLDCWFGDLIFSAGQFKFRGYVTFINGTETDITLLSFASLDKYEIMHDFLLSALDSFSLNSKGKKTPGPVSQYYYGSFRDTSSSAAEIKLNGNKFIYNYDRNEIETTRIVIEREARILSAYKSNTKDGIDAWCRYYRIIYRDNYSRLNKYSEYIYQYSKSNTATNFDFCSSVLSWIQGFSYVRTGTLGDLTGPLEIAVTKEGDCDSRGLLYIIILKHYGIDAILLVSTKYNHSIAAVDVQGNGARYEYKGKKYLTAETTENVDIGLIASDMADPSGWVAVDFED